MDTVKERLKSFIDHKNISVRLFEATCGLSYGYVGNMRKSIQPDKISRIAQHYPDLNTGWLLTGEGRMINGPYERINLILRREGISEKEFAKGAGFLTYVNPTIYKHAQKNPGDPIVLEQWIDALLKRFPYYSRNWIMTGEGNMRIDDPTVAIKDSDLVPYYASDFLDISNQPVINQDSTPDNYIHLPIIQGAEAWVGISGKSMSPLINPGDIIALQQIKDWKTNILFGEVYAIATDLYRTVKRIRRSDKEGWLRLVPENRDYDPQDIPASSIISIYKVLGCARKIS